MKQDNYWRLLHHIPYRKSGYMSGGLYAFQQRSLNTCRDGYW